MSWSLNVQGSKTHVHKYVTEAECNASFPPEEKEQFERARSFIFAELANIPKSDAVKVAAGGSMSVGSKTQGDPREIFWSQATVSVEPIRLTGMSPND